MADKDCKVCERLMKEKHKTDVWWKVCAIIFLAFAVVLAILYFGSGSITTETNIEIENSHIGNEIQGSGSVQGDNSILIGSDGSTISGTIAQQDYTPIICISIVVAAAIITVGGIIIANHNKKDD